MDDKGQDEEENVQEVDSFVAFLGWLKKQLIGLGAA